MKVTRDKEFTPITIVIETEKEAENLWYRLNISNYHVQQEQADYSLTTAGEVNLNMFRKLNCVYNPKK